MKIGCPTFELNNVARSFSERLLPLSSTVRSLKLRATSDIKQNCNLPVLKACFFLRGKFKELRFLLVEGNDGALTFNNGLPTSYKKSYFILMCSKEVGCSFPCLFAPFQAARVCALDSTDSFRYHHWQELYDGMELIMRLD